VLVSVSNLSGLHIDHSDEYLRGGLKEPLVASSVAKEFFDQPLKGLGVVEGIGEEKGEKIWPVSKDILLLHILIEVDEIGNVLTRHKGSDQGTRACSYNDIEAESEFSTIRYFTTPAVKAPLAPPPLKTKALLFAIFSSFELGKSLLHAGEDGRNQLTLDFRGIEITSFIMMFWFLELKHDICFNEVGKILKGIYSF